MYLKKQKGLAGIYPILTVVFLLLSVVVSVLLVKTNQDIRDLAGSPCSPDGCNEAFCDTSSGSEVPSCKTCTNGTWGASSPCGHPEVCGDPNNPNDNSAKNLGGCTYIAPQPKCGDGTCSDGENCDPQSDHYCIADCNCPTLPVVDQSGCPTDVTGYVSQSGSLQPGYHNCNGNAWCLVLNLPPEHSHCTYLAEAYTDAPQDCDNQEANIKKSETIGNGGQICFGDFDWGSDCKAQIDIRFSTPGSPAGNLKTYKEVCGSKTISTSTPTPTKIITNSPTPTPTKIITNTPTPTKTPTPTPTKTPTPTVTNTPPPGSTSTPTPLASNTPTPTNTPAPGDTATPVPTSAIAQGPSPTRIALPEAGVDFPAKGLFLSGAIIALFGLLILL